MPKGWLNQYYVNYNEYNTTIKTILQEKLFQDKKNGIIIKCRIRNAK